MAHKRKSLTKPAVKSTGATTKLGYGQTSRNANTLRKLEKAKSLENEIIPLNDTVENIEAIINLEINTQSKY